MRHRRSVPSRGWSGRSPDAVEAGVAEAHVRSLGSEQYRRRAGPARGSAPEPRTAIVRIQTISYAATAAAPAADPGAYLDRRTRQPSPEMQGFFFPRTASGRSSLIPSPPWSYSGDLLTVEYRTDPARVAELLPAPLELGPRGPGRRRTDLGRLAVVLVSSRGAARPGAVAVQGVLRRGALLLPGARPTPAASTSGSTRTSRSLEASTRATRRSSARCGRPGRMAFPHASPQIGAGRRVRRHARRGRPAPGRRRADPHAARRRPTASSTATRWPTTGSIPTSPGTATPTPS